MKWHFILVSKKMGHDQLDKGRAKRRYNKCNEKRHGTKNARKRITINAQNVKMREDEPEG